MANSHQPMLLQMHQDSTFYEFDMVVKVLIEIRQHPECFPIAVPHTDPFYGPRGVKCLDFVRSSPAPRDDCALGWREQMNQVSAYIDGSPIYASSARQSDKLRLFRNGKILISISLSMFN